MFRFISQKHTQATAEQGTRSKTCFKGKGPKNFPLASPGLCVILDNFNYFKDEELSPVFPPDSYACAERTKTYYEHQIRISPNRLKMTQNHFQGYEKQDEEI